MYGYSQDPLRIPARSASAFIALAHAAWSGAGRWIGTSWLAKALAAVAAERAARKAVHALESWDDHMLRDVGLERMDIEAAIRGVRPPFNWEPDCDPVKRHRLRNFD